jgi:Family of unknown function (DUF6353)
MSMEAIAKRFAGQTELFLKKHGPEILTGIGVVGFGATTYLVGKAVLKAQKPLEELRADAHIIASKEVAKEYTKRDKQQEIGRLYVHRGLEIAKIFSPAIAAGGMSVICVISAHGLMQRKQTALVAAYTALDAGFKAYRQRVREEIGEEKERELYRRPVMRAVDQVESEEPVYEIDKDAARPSQYGRFYDQFNIHWSKTPEWNMMQLRVFERSANDMLNAKGFLFLNEVYDMLGFDWTQAGQVVGWRNDGDGDGYVDFGLYADEERNRDFINGEVPSIFLDFNVDGPIAI